MICPNCRTEIADKAIVCFRCGAPTAAPSALQATPRAGRGGLVAALALLVLVVGALYLGQAQTGAVPRSVAWGVAAVGATVAVWRFIALRRR